jgi:hypothetical protein
LCLLKEIGNRHRSVGRCWLERLLLQSGDRSSVTGTTSAIDDYTKLQAQETGRTTDPLRPVLARVRANKLQLPLAENVGTDRNALAPTLAAAAIRQNSQLPAFAPLLEELEVAGWSSHRRTLSGNFHDWTLLEGRTLLVMAGQAVPSQADDAIDPIEAALVAQGAWASIRSHSHHATDAGTLMSLAAQCRRRGRLPGAKNSGSRHRANRDEPATIGSGPELQLRQPFIEAFASRARLARGR